MTINLNEENESVGELSTVCAQIVLNCLYLARIGRPDILRSVNKLAYAVTKWTKSCDKRLTRLISDFITQVNTDNTVMWETQQNNADCERSRTLILQEISKTQNQHQEEFYAFSEVTPLYRSVGCARSILQFHSSTGAEIISLDAGLRMDGIPTLVLWDLVIEIFHSAPSKIKQPTEKLRRNPFAVVKPNMHNLFQCKHTNVVLTNIDHIPSKTTNSGANAMLYVFEDKEAVIKTIIKGRSPTMRHVSRTHRFALDWLLTESIWTPKSKFLTLSPNTQSQTS